MTANAMTGDREKCLKAGMDEYLSKPIRTEDLARVFAKWLPQQAHETSPQDKAPPPAAPPFPPPAIRHSTLNVQTLIELEDLGGRKFLQAMIQMFVEDALQCVTLIEQALDAQNIHHLQEAAHGLKGIARNMGADSLAQLAVKIEANCKAGNTAPRSEWSPRIQRMFQQTRQELEDVLRNA
jgi:HPt (histidine-containing phosphotransfer) domain-containing protein